MKDNFLSTLWMDGCFGVFCRYVEVFLGFMFINSEII